MGPYIFIVTLSKWAHTGSSMVIVIFQHGFFHNYKRFVAALCGAVAVEENPKAGKLTRGVLSNVGDFFCI
jgi:hypothetical protein